MKRFLTALLLLINAAVPTSGQTKSISALLQNVHEAKTDRARLDAIFALGEEYKSLNRDTLDKYAYQAQALTISSDEKRIKAEADLIMAYMYSRWGWSDSTLVSIADGLKFSSLQDVTTRPIYFKLMRQKALILGGKSRFKEALDVLYTIVVQSEQYKDTLTISTNLNTIASIALARGKPAEAIPILNRALGLTGKNLRYVAVKSTVLVNMAEVYVQLKDWKRADQYIQEGISLCRETENLNGLAIALQKQSDIFLASKRIAKAENALKELLDVRKSLGDPSVWVDDNLSLINFYIETGQVDKAIAVCKQNIRQGSLSGAEAKDLGVLTNSINIRLKYYEELARCYKIKGNQTQYSRMLENIVAAKDSFYEANSANAIAELQTKYDVQKKENTIIQQQFDLLKKDYLFYAALLLLVFLATLGIVLFRNYRRKQSMRMEFMQEEEKRKSKEAVKEAEEKERKRISRDLHDNLGAYAASLGSNIERLSRSSFQAEHVATLQELKNNSQAIMSMLNDTIWVLRKEAHSLTSISDRIKLFILRIQPSYPDITIDFIEEIENDRLLAPLQAFNLFQIIGEGINNALRHSGGSFIQVSFISNAKSRVVIIADNGNGFAVIETKSYGGNGLINMRNRASESGWKIEWIANDSAGTKIVLSTTN